MHNISIVSHIETIILDKQSSGYQIYAFYYTFLQYFSINRQHAGSQ